MMPASTKNHIVYLAQMQLHTILSISLWW